VLNANSNLVEVINAYETVRLTAKEKKSVEDSLERLRQDCDKGISIVISLTQALAVLQPEDMYLPNQPSSGPTGASQELGLFCTVRSFLSDPPDLIDYLLPIGLVRAVPGNVPIAFSTNTCFRSHFQSVDRGTGEVNNLSWKLKSSIGFATLRYW
jgi:hypothetical protein